MEKSYKNKIIWSAVVTDNNDPLMLNRIRVQLDTENYESIIKSVPDTYNGRPTKDLNKSPVDLLPEFKWSKIDPLCFLPLLPLFIKITPKLGEYVNIIYPNPEYKYTEQYYILGSFSSPLTMFRQDANASRMFVTRDRITNSRLLKNPTNGEYYISKTKGVFPEPEDNALLGRGTCDIIVKENDVLLRAGKSNRIPDNANREIVAKTTRSFLQLSNFDQRIVDLGIKESVRLQQDISFVKTLVEWHIINPENQFNNFQSITYIYRLPEKPTYTTKTLTINSSVSLSDKSLVATYNFSGTSADTINFINNIITGINDGRINLPPNPILEVQYQFPCIFRPSTSTYQWISQTTITGSSEYINVSQIKEKIKFKTASGGFGLIFNKDTTGQQNSIRIDKYRDYEYQNTPTTCGIMGGDKLLFLSHESKIPNKSKINLNELTIYGITQDFITKNIIPNTDSMVRGDQLIGFLNLVIKFVVSHVHPYHGMPPTPVAMDGTSSQQILVELQNAVNTILNPNLRIN